MSLILKDDFIYGVITEVTLVTIESPILLYLSECKFKVILRLKFPSTCARLSLTRIISPGH